MVYDFEVRKLSQRFYDDYSGVQYMDLIKKLNRRYNMLLVETHYDYYICIPFRSHISHEFAYKFKNSIRSQTCNSGLDYTKICIISKPEYIDDDYAVVDSDEYTEMVKNINTIVNEAVAYINEYVNHIKDVNKISKKKFRKKYYYSSLKYFHKELGI